MERKILSVVLPSGLRNHRDVSTGDSPKWPFKPGEKPVTPDGWHCLDGTLYEDRKGSRPWMVFCHEWLQVNDGQICAVPLSDNLERPQAKPVILFRAWTGHGCKDDEEQRMGNGRPFSFYRLKSGVLIMLWSSFSEKGGYTTGYARSLRRYPGPGSRRREPLYAMDGAHSCFTILRDDGAALSQQA